MEMKSTEYLQKFTAKCRHILIDIADVAGLPIQSLARTDILEYAIKAAQTVIEANTAYREQCAAARQYVRPSLDFDGHIADIKHSLSNLMLIRAARHCMESLTPAECSAFNFLVDNSHGEYAYDYARFSVAFSHVEEINRIVARTTWESKRNLTETEAYQASKKLRNLVQKKFMENTEAQLRGEF